MSIWTSSEKLENYFSLPVFVVMGASTDKSKFGYKVLKCLAENKKECIPINKKVDQIDGIRTLGSLSNLKSYMENNYSRIPMSSVGLNIITPPGVTLMSMQEAYTMGIRNFFLQPGTYDAEVDEYIKQIENAKESYCNIIKDCVLIKL